MLDAKYTDISATDREAALTTVGTLVATLGNWNEREIAAFDLHRVLALASAIVLEASGDFVEPDDFRTASAYLGEVIAHHARNARDERLATGRGLADCAMDIYSGPSPDEDGSTARAVQ